MSLAKTGGKHFGKSLPDETKSKISKAHKGENHYLFGKSQTEETKSKISSKLGHAILVYDIETEDKPYYTSINQGLSCSS